jgi:hypothetical protein
MNKLFALASLVLSFHVVGCAAQSASEEGAAGEATATEQSALNNAPGGGGGAHGYSCAGLVCNCTGDVDCNDMFGSGVCGDVAQCDNSTDPPTCWCFKALRVSHISKIGAAGATTKLDTAP